MGNKGNKITRGLRALFVLLPIVGFGTWLGLGGRLGTQRVSPKEYRPEKTSQDVVVVTDRAAPSAKSGGNTAKTAKAKPAGAGFDDTIHLTNPLGSGKPLDLVCEVSPLSLPQAIKEYDRRYAVEGWTYSKILTAQIKKANRGGVLRCYKKKNAVRIVTLGPRIEQDSTGLPVTIFTGSFAER